MSNGLPDHPPSRPEAALRLRAWWDARTPNVRGSLWVALAVVLFSIMTMLIKLLGARLPVVEILFFRQIVMLGFIAPVLWRHGADALKTERAGLHTFRVTAALFAMLTGFTALVHMPLADATAISFAKTLFVTVLATLILHETVGLRRWTATVVGFVGVLVVLQPTGAGIDVYALLALASAVAVAGIQISLRLLTQTERSVTIMAYQAIAITVLLALPTWWWWVTPTPLEWAALVATGFVATLGQWCNVTGFRTGEAAAVAPMDYTRILFATIIGSVVFHELPTMATVLGAAIIIGATLYTLRRNAMRTQQA